MSRRSSSKFKNVFADPAKPEKQIQDIRNPMTSGEGSYVTASAKYFAVPIASGGGPCYVNPLTRVGRLGANPTKLMVGKGKTLDLAFSPFNDSMIATAGDDMNVSISMLPEDPEELKENITEAAQVCKGHGKKIGLLEWNPVANNVISSASYDRTVKTWDITSGSVVNTFEDFGDNIYSLKYNENGSLLATTAKDKKFRLFDPRTNEVAFETEPFDGGKSSKVWWMPDKNWVGVVGFSRQAKRQIRIYDMANFDKPVYKKDYDNASSVIQPFYDRDTELLYFVGKGDGGIVWFEVQNTRQVLYKTSLGFRQTVPQKGGCFIPKRACDTSKHEIGRFLKLTRDSVIPVSFIAPRKSEAYQPDLYPDTYAGVPSLEADKWIAGENADPILTSMDPEKGGGAKPSGGGTTFVKKKSYAELEKENASLQARVKELEEQLAELTC